MIIKCEKCQTKFRLDDSRVTDKGVKVRCTKCKQVFTVRKENPVEESAAPSPFMADVENEEQTVSDGDRLFSDEPAPAAPFQAESFLDSSTPDAAPDFSGFESSFVDSEITFESGSVVGTGSGTLPEAAADTGDVDFSGFDFGDSEAETETVPQSTLSVDDFTEENIITEASATPKETPQGLDFSDDDMFGAVVQSAPEPTKETITFDFEGDSFAESMDVGGQDAGGKGGNLYSLESAGDAPFSLGEIDFGDELTSVAVQQVNPEDLKPSQEILFAPLAEAQDKSADDELTKSFLDEEPASFQQDLPPLSISSRRKQNPLAVGIAAVVVLLVIAVLGYFGFSSLSTPKEAAVIDNGKIGVRAVTAAYIDNDEAGELLVISGEALNEYPKPRAALQVKVTVFDGTGLVVATKSAYSGNPLTEEQLEGLPLEKLEAAMANQFGDSLANMEVAPGKAIPFVVVLANLPKGAKDFTVQSAGSTVATGKQQ